MRVVYFTQILWVYMQLTRALCVWLFPVVSLTLPLSPSQQSHPSALSPFSPPKSISPGLFCCFLPLSLSLSPPPICSLFLPLSPSVSSPFPLLLPLQSVSPSLPPSFSLKQKNPGSHLISSLHVATPTMTKKKKKIVRTCISLASCHLHCLHPSPRLRTGHVSACQQAESCRRDIK